MDDRFNDVLLSLMLSKYDSQSSKNEEYANDLNDVQDEFIKRNRELTTLLKNYISEREKRVKVNSTLKTILFLLFISLLIALTVTVIVVFCKVDFNKINATSVTGVLSVAVTYIGSLLSIFKIMSKYLFPINEEKDTIDMIKVVLNNDTQVEELLTKTSSNNKSLMVSSLYDYKEMLDREILTQEEYDTLKKEILSPHFNNKE